MNEQLLESLERDPEAQDSRFWATYQACPDPEEVELEIYKLDLWIKAMQRVSIFNERERT